MRHFTRIIIGYLKNALFKHFSWVAQLGESGQAIINMRL